MTRPNLFVRFAGSPLGALLLFAVYIAIGMHWYQGDAPWWLALGAVGGALRTWRAVRHMRAYKQWRAEWQMMGQEDETPQLSKPRSCGWVYAIGFLLMVGIPVSLTGVQDQAQSNLLAMIWVLVCLFLLFAVGRALLRRMKRRRQEKALIAPITCLLARPFSSPSRAAAQKALPEYTRLVMEAGNHRGGKIVDAVEGR